MSEATIPRLFIESLAENHNPQLLNQRMNSTWCYLSSAELYEKVKYLALGLHSLGLKKRETIALAARLSPMTIIADLAIIISGARSLHVMSHSDISTLEFMLQDSSVRYMFCGSCQNLEQIRRSRSSLRKIIPLYVDFEGKDIMTLQALSEWGRELDRVDPDMFHTLIKNVNADNIAHIYYQIRENKEQVSSVKLTNRELYRSIERLESKLTTTTHNDSIITLCSTINQTNTLLQYAAMHIGASTYYLEAIDDIVPLSYHIRPRLLSLPSKSIEKLHTSFATQSKAGHSPFTAFENSALHWAEQSPPSQGSLVKTLANLLVLNSYRNKLGGRVNLIINQDAPITGLVRRFFANMNMPIFNAGQHRGKPPDEKFSIRAK